MKHSTTVLSLNYKSLAPLGNDALPNGKHHSSSTFVYPQSQTHFHTTIPLKKIGWFPGKSFFPKLLGTKWTFPPQESLVSLGERMNFLARKHHYYLVSMCPRPKYIFTKNYFNRHNFQSLKFILYLIIVLLGGVSSQGSPSLNFIDSTLLPWGDVVIHSLRIKLLITSQPCHYDWSKFWQEHKIMFFLSKKGICAFPSRLRCFEFHPTYTCLYVVLHSLTRI